MESEATVYLIDDDEAQRDSIRSLLGTVGHEVAAFATAREFLDAYRAGASQVLLLEVRLRGLSGLQLQQRLVQQGHVLPTIFLTDRGDARLAVQAMKQGALDFLEKPFDPQCLIDSVRFGLERCKVLVRQHAREAMLQQKLSLLTRREHELLDLLLDGHKSRTIATRFGMTEQTVDQQRALIMRKLDAHSVPELVRIALAADADADEPMR
jgi:FixJ family two-component response regulator